MTSRLDGLLSEAAAVAPDRAAVVCGDRSLDFATLDRRVSLAAGALRGLLPQPGATVAVAAVLDPDFPVAYYAAVRAGHVAAVINPLLREQDLVHLLTSSKAAAVFVDAALYERLGAVLGQLPRVRHLVLFGARPDGAAPPDGALTLEGFLDGPDGARAPAADADADPDRVAAIQFTSGTTGLPKAVPLTHRNLTVNAAQISRAHRLDGGSVCLNHLPTYHPMHLNSAVRAGATQVLCTAADPVHAVSAANRYGATHFYSLPMRLARLADSEALDGLELTSVRHIGSGGSALAPAAAARLTERFGIPVFQGYGLAETSPLTHSDDPDRPVHGSVGRPVEGTECRIVDVETRAVLPAGAQGEVQLRGPQVMRGYLGAPAGSGLEADGWLSAGDVGRIDAEGRLFLIDRLKDTFKTDNFLVAPSQIEQVLGRDPLVRESVVVDLPDEFSGSVAAALVVLRPGVTDYAAELARIADRVAEQVPYYQRLHRLMPVTSVPRSPVGKIQRRALRDWLLDLIAKGTPVSQPQFPPGLFTIVNTFVLKDLSYAEEFESRFLDHVGWMRAQDGFDSHQAVRLTDRPGTYVNIGRWLSPGHFQQVRTSETFTAHAEEFHKLVDVSAEPSLNVLRAGDADPQAPVVAVAVLSAEDGAAGAQAYEAAYAGYVERLAAQEGFRHADLSRSVVRPGGYTFASWWASQEAREAAEQAVAAPGGGAAEPGLHVTSAVAAAARVPEASGHAA